MRVWSVRPSGSAGNAAPMSLAALVAERGVESCLVTDEPRVAKHSLAERFGQRVLLESFEPRGAALDVADVAMARVFAAAAEWIESARAPFLLWVHAQGMAAGWDAPYELRASMADEEDPPPPRFIAPPDLTLAKGYDPDELLGVTQAYCGQIAALDACLGLLRESLAESPHHGSTLFTLLSSRGFPLGEHGRVGGENAPLYGELVSIPWFLRLPDGAGSLGRGGAIVAHDDLPATLAAWWTPALDKPIAPRRSGRARDLLPLVREEVASERRWATISGVEGERAIRTPAWFLRKRPRGHRHSGNYSPSRAIGGK